MNICVAIAEGKRNCLTEGRMNDTHSIQNPCGQHDFTLGCGIMPVYISDCWRNMPFPFNRITPTEKNTIDTGIGCCINKTDLTANTHIYDIFVLL